MANVNTNESKRVPVIACEIEGTGLQLKCAAVGAMLTLDGANLSPAIREQAMMHGLKQKLIDAAAISRNPDTGKSASPADKWAAVNAVYERLLRGEWNAQRGDGTGNGGLLFRALCRMYGTKTPDQIREFLDGKTDAEKAALRKNPKVAAIIVEIQAEAGKAGDVDSDALLGELGD